MLRPRSEDYGNKHRVKLAGQQETYAPVAMAFLLTSVIRVFCPHSELVSLNYGKCQNALPFLYKRGEELKICLAITKFKSLSTYYKFIAWLIYLTNFFGGDLILYLGR